jgi:hypothetical protein
LDPIKSLLNALTTAVLFLILFITLLPPLLRVLHREWAQWVYGALVAAGVLLAVRLRGLSRRL